MSVDENVTTPDAEEGTTPDPVNANVRVVEGPNGEPIELVKWHITPIWMPGEAKDVISEKAAELDMKISEYVLACCMMGAGYGDEDVLFPRRLVFPTTRKTERE